MPEDGIKKSIQLQEIAPFDLEDVARFISRVSGSKAPLAAAVARLKWILLENPAREPGDPLGWLLRSATGDVVGCSAALRKNSAWGKVSFD